MSLDRLPKRELFPVKSAKEADHEQEVAKPKPARLNMKILEGIARRGGQVPVEAASHVRLVSAGPSLLETPLKTPLKTPLSGLGPHMGVLGHGLVDSPRALSALSPPSTRQYHQQQPIPDISHAQAQANAVAPYLVMHNGRKMTFSPLPPEPDGLGRCTLIDEQGEAITVFPRELKDWLQLPWVPWMKLCNRKFNLWYVPQKGGKGTGYQ
jgi:hypothetical protein